MRIDVIEGDATAANVDILALKYAQARHGLDRHVHQLLSIAKVEDHEMSPQPGQHSLIWSRNTVSARRVLWVGVEKLSQVLYPELRAFAKALLNAVATERPDAKTLAVTLHGAGFGLDESESFLSMLAGFEEAVREGTAPRALTRLIFYERVRSRANYLRELLDQVLPGGTLSVAPVALADSSQLLGTSTDALDRLRSATIASATRSHVFVAMPFADEFQDIYHYAIQNAVNRSGLLCERADVTAFTGDILTHVKERIRSAELLIADLSGANPNVYLEVGYAWGCQVPCVLLVRDGEELKFDVRGQRCLVYKLIKDLELKLADELAGLRATAPDAALKLSWPERR